MNDQMDGKQLSSLRVATALCGDIAEDPESIVKYGTFFEALGKRFSLKAVYNAKLKGLQRIKNIIFVWHPNQKKWRARADKNPDGFIVRSRQAARWVKDLEGQVDFLLQLGVLFDSGWENSPLPRLIYTDYTASMSASRPAAGRSPFSGKTLYRWLELERRAMQKAVHICVRSSAVRDSLIRDYVFPSERISVVGGGVNLPHLPNIPLKPINRTPTVLFIGTDFYRKGGDLVLNAFAYARASIPNAQLIFVSQDSVPSSYPRRGVKFLAPIWDRESFLDLYCQADILIQPSRLETWGDVILEAMAYGLPCIGVLGQPMEEIIRNEETGLLVPPERVDSLTEALIRLLRQPLLSRQMGEAGRRLVAREFTWDRVVGRIAPIIEATVLR
jgi:glycosyltransferase involved in cell wall biosynthesis